MKTAETEAQVDAHWKWRQKEQNIPLSFITSYASVDLMLQTLKCEPVLVVTEVQAEG